MNISFDWGGCYLEHRSFFDVMAHALQAAGHKVGIITGERDTKKVVIVSSLGFKPDFISLWGEYESIANGNLWKCKAMDKHNVTTHFDDDATEMKRYTSRGIIKVLNSGEPKKF